MTVLSNAVLNLGGSGTLNLYGVLTNAGTVNWGGTATLEVYNYVPYGYTGGIVNQAGAVFNVLNDQSIFNWGYNFAYFNNYGLVGRGGRPSWPGPAPAHGGLRAAGRGLLAGRLGGAAGLGRAGQGGQPEPAARTRAVPGPARPRPFRA